MVPKCRERWECDKNIGSWLTGQAGFEIGPNLTALPYSLKWQQVGMKDPKG